MRKIQWLLLTMIVLSMNTLNAFEAGDWLLRLRGIAVIPTGTSNSLSTVPNSGVKVSTSGTAELDFTYMWTCNIGTELILATTKHNIKGRGALSGVNVGSTWALPPTLTFQYHFMPNCCFQPYVGAGVNYTVFYSEHSSLPETRLSLQNTWGFAAQAGCDYMITERCFVNVDCKYITMDTKANLKGTTHGHVQVRINPVVVGAGIGYRF